MTAETIRGIKAAGSAICNAAQDQILINTGNVGRVFFASSHTITNVVDTSKRDALKFQSAQSMASRK